MENSFKENSNYRKKKDPTNIENNKSFIQAIKSHSKGKTDEAAINYQSCLDLGYKDIRILLNYAVICRQKGNLSKAIELYEKLINIFPDSPEGYSNLGNVQMDIGDFDKAEKSIRKAIELKPDFDKAYYNLGKIMVYKNKLQEAANFTYKAIKITPNYIIAYTNLGNILKEIGKEKEAFECYLKAIKLDPKIYSNYSLIASFLRDANPKILDQYKLKNILNILLHRNDIRHNELFKAFNQLYNSRIIDTINKANFDYCNNKELREFINSEIVLKAMNNMIFIDKNWEYLLTNLRKELCRVVALSSEDINNQELKLIISIANQCFLNEYIFDVTPEEDKAVSIIKDNLDIGNIDIKSIAILACYLPLYKINKIHTFIDSINSSIKDFKELFISQVEEPLEEIRLSKEIKYIGKIKNKISQKVQSQYEKNPYPRWRFARTFKNFKVYPIQLINREIRPNAIKTNPGSKHTNILIAGCGTGNQIFDAQKYINSNITAIDLSSTSLAYAQRKINEFDINNVELFHMDLLDISLLDKKFDIIECGGVLHHMENPLIGLQSINQVLNDNGFMKLGLYSDLARQNVIKAREYIDYYKLKPNTNDIRAFRKNVFAGNIPEINSLTKSRDFYNISSVLDLCFNIQEKRFNISELKMILKENDLKFLGFYLPKQIKSVYKQSFPLDKSQTNLDLWEKFENKYIDIFKGMYQFWVQKIKP